MFDITLWPGLRLTQGEPRSLTWEDLCVFLSPNPPPMFAGEGTEPGAVDETGMAINPGHPLYDPGQAGWSPARFEGNKRSKATITYVSVFATEHDSGSSTVDQALARMANLGLRCLLVTTKSHTPTEPRFRILIPLSRPVSAVERDVIVDCAHTWGLDLAVPETRDPSRFWFTTCRGEHPDSGIAFQLEGDALDVDSLLAAAELRRARAIPASTSARPAGASRDGSAGYVSRALDRAFEAVSRAGKGERHSVLAREAYAIGGLVGGGYIGRGEAERVLIRACDLAWSDPIERDRDGYRTARTQLAAGSERPRTVEAPTRPPGSNHLRLVKDGEGESNRTVIMVRKGEIPRMVEEAITALAKGDDHLYTREGELIHVSTSGAPKLYSVTPPGLTERLAKVADWVKSEGPTDPPPPVVHAVIARRSWPELRPLAGVVQAPTLRPDGSLISSAGYDAPTRMLYIPNEPWPELPPEPTRDDANHALCELFDAFIDFPWESEDGIYVAISAVLTVIARPAINGAVPVFIFDANSPGSGKTLVADTIATIATGREAGRHSYPSEPKGANEEVAKVLTGYAIGGAQVLCWDNLSPDCLFGGPALESVSTARDTASFRILGKSENVTIPWRTVMLATGNNVAITRDLERRSLVPRFVARWETADSRPIDTFRHPERFGRLLSWARSERVRLVGCALTLLRAYHLAGRPSTGQRWASFEEWTDLIPSAMVWAGGKSPLACRPADTGRVSPEREALTVILRDWHRLDVDSDGVSIRTALALLYPEQRPVAGPPDGLDELRDALETLAPPKGGRIDPTRLAGAFRRLRQVSVGGRAIESTTGRAGVVRWIVR